MAPPAPAAADDPSTLGETLCACPQHEAALRAARAAPGVLPRVVLSSGTHRSLSYGARLRCGCETVTVLRLSRPPAPAMSTSWTDAGRPTPLPLPCPARDASVDSSAGTSLHGLLRPWQCMPRCMHAPQKTRARALYMPCCERAPSTKHTRPRLHTSPTTRPIKPRAAALSAASTPPAHPAPPACRCSAAAGQARRAAYL